MEQGSYMLIRDGMTVRGTDADLGSVAEVVADERVDVFRGIVLKHGLLLPARRFISAEHIIAVQETTVHVDLSKAEADQLPLITPESSQGKETIS